MKKVNRIVLLGAVVVVLVVLMRVGLNGWNSLVVPNLGKLGQFSLPLLLGFAFLAGGVSFFAPCSFALFPGYVALYLGAEKHKKEHPAVLGIMASLGVMTFFIVLSAILMIVGKGITPYLGYAAPAIGFILVLMGLILFAGHSFKTGLVQKILDKLRSKETRSKRNIYLFGVGYGAVSMGCTLPLLFAMVIAPLTTGKIYTVFLSLLVYAIAMSLLMIFVTYLVAWSEDKILKKLVKSTGTIKKLSGLALIVIGAYLVYYNLLYSMLL